MIDVINSSRKISEDEYGFYSLASEFQEAGCILHAHIATKLKVDSASMYLLCHSAELYLKSYLLVKQGEEVFKSKNYRHDIKKLISSAYNNGLSVQLNSLLSISNVYKSKQLEYRQNQAIKLVSIDDLISEVEELSIVVFNDISL